MSVGVGIEIAPTAVRAVVLEGPPALKVRASAERSCESANREALTHALAQLRKDARIQQPVVLGLPTTSTILATLQPLVPDPRRAHLAVQFELQQLLPFEVQEAQWHHQWLSPPNPAIAPPSFLAKARTGGGMVVQQPLGGQDVAPIGAESLVRRALPVGLHGQRPMALVAAMRRSRLDEHLSACQRAGLAVQAVSVHAAALLNARASITSVTSSEVALLHLVSAESAEWILWTPSGLQVLPVTRASSGTLAEEILMSWESVQASVPARVAKIQIAGQVEGQAALVELLRTRLNLPVEPLEVGGARGSAVAMGLALQGVGVGSLRLNLLSAIQHDRRQQTLRRLSWAASSLCAVSAIGVGISGMVELSERRSHVLKALERREQLYQTLRPDVRALLLRQEQMQQRTRHLEELVRGAPLLTHVLADVVRALPKTVWLTKAEWSKGPANVEGVLEGRAYSFQEVTRLMESLKTTAGMSNVKLLSAPVSAEGTSGRDVILFTIQVERPINPQSAIRNPQST